MPEHGLAFADEYGDSNLFQQKLAHFRDKGYVVLNDVFERESVDGFRAEVEAALDEAEGESPRLPPDSPLSIAPVEAPRIRQILPEALYYAERRYQPALEGATWIVSEGGESEAERETSEGDLYDVRTPGTPRNWHKDESYKGLRSYSEYHHPLSVHVRTYLEDMTPERGPTEVVPRSHRDETLAASEENAEPMLVEKQDAFLWDQRLWHRARPRTASGYRVFALFTFYLLPLHAGDEQRRPSAAQYEAWRRADDAEKAFYGGLFDCPES
ncbi:MAG: phytanoyl-CoA dioxygenase family protein [Halobacteriaceae archaeon]